MQLHAGVVGQEWNTGRGNHASKVAVINPFSTARHCFFELGTVLLRQTAIFGKTVAKISFKTSRLAVGRFLEQRIDGETSA